MIKMGYYQSDRALADASRLRHATLKRKLFSSKNESEVRQFFLALYDLDLVGSLEKHRIDFAHPEIWIEMKFKADMDDMSARSKIIAQILHYLHYAPIKRGERMLPETFAIVDKSHIIMYNTSDFGKYIINTDYFKGIKNPSSSHPQLERALFSDPLIRAMPLNIISEYDEVWSELEKRGAYA